MKVSEIEMFSDRLRSNAMPSEGRGRIGCRPCRGFTLLEVVAAIFIFLMGVVGVISLFASATVFHKDACDRTFCALLIENVVPDIERKLSAGILREPNGKLKPIRDGFIEGHDRYGYEAEFEEHGAPGHSMIRATIFITWKDKGKTRSERFDHVFRSGPAHDDSVKALREGADIEETGDVSFDTPEENK